jgi:hypothetical protein
MIWGAIGIAEGMDERTDDRLPDIRLVHAFDIDTRKLQVLLPLNAGSALELASHTASM